MKLLIAIILLNLNLFADVKPQIKLNPGKYSMSVKIFENGKESEMFSQMKSMLKAMPKEQRKSMLAMSKSMMKTDVDLEKIMDETFCHKDNLEKSFNDMGASQQGCTKTITTNSATTFIGTFDCKERGKGKFIYKAPTPKSYNADIDFTGNDSKSIQVKIEGIWQTSQC